MREGILVAAPFDLERLELTGGPVPIVEGVWTAEYGTAHFALSGDGTLAYVPPADDRSLVWVDRAGAVRPITTTRGQYEDPRLSPDGQRLALTIRHDARAQIWIYEMARDAFDRLSLGPDEAQAPLWTPDGRRLAFRKGVSSHSNLFWVPVDGSGPEERLTTSPHLQRPSSWSPDGKVLVYSEAQSAEGAEDIWLLTLGSEPRERPFLQTPFRDRAGALSPDGRWMAYISNESGANEVYVRPFPDPGGRSQISSQGGLQPVWDRSGRELFYRNGNKMMAVAIETKPTFRAGKPAALFEGTFSNPAFGSPQYDVAPDGKHFVMLQSTWPTRIQVVLNWFEELKERVPAAKH